MWERRAWAGGIVFVVALLAEPVVPAVRGVIGTYSLVLDLIGFVLFLLFVLVCSAILLSDRGPAHSVEA